MRAILRPAIGLLTVFTVGCKAPPEAPEKLEELAAFLFDHADDDDPEALRVGVENLDAWLGNNLEEAREGYTIDTLSDAAIEGVGGDPAHAVGLVGAAVATTLPRGTKRVTKALVLSDPTQVYPGTYSTYDRDWIDDPNCFADRDCDSADMRAHTVSDYPMNLEVTSDFKAQYRWVETDAGMAMVQRTWLRRPAEVSVDWMSVPAQFFLSVNLPHQDGKTLRLQTTWISAELGDTPVPEATALNMVIDSMTAGDEELAEWVR